MHAVLRIYLQALDSLVIFHDLIDPRRTITLCRFVIQGKVVADRNFRVAQGQMTGLVFLVVGIGEEHRGQAIETQHIVRLRIGNLPGLGGRLQLLVIRVHVVQGPRQLAAEYIDIDERIGGTEHVAELVLGRSEIALHLQFLTGPGTHERLGVGADFLAHLFVHSNRAVH